MARRKETIRGGHGWFVTFADLMGLLVAFFVMLIAFSTQDLAKLQVVAGSMRDAFGVQDRTRYSGVVEVSGHPTRPRLKNVAPINPDQASANPTPEAQGREKEYGANVERDRNFSLAAASLRQALQDMPELTELSKHIMVEESKDGLNIEIVDQNGRSMFSEGSKEPNERMRRLISRIAGPLKAAAFRVSIAGHSSATRLPTPAGYGPWDLSADRANAVRRQLEADGVPTSHFYMVAGRADTQPLFPDDPYIAANRRVTITLMREEPPIPPAFKP